MNTRQLCDRCISLRLPTLPGLNSISVPGASGVVLNNCLIEGGRKGLELALQRYVWHFVLPYFEDHRVIRNNYFLINNSKKVNKHFTRFNFVYTKNKTMLCFNNLSLLDRGLKRVRSVSTNQQLAPL